jgi:DNA polymerase III epsilon subunit-like protein
LEKLLEDLAVADGTSRATTEAFHRALQDAMATKVLYAKCVEKLPPRPTPMACPHQHVLDCLSQGKFAP